MNANQNLFFYGLWADLQRGIGIVIIGISFILMIKSLILGIVVLCVGSYIGLIGTSKRFDYQRQSGSIIHRGDW